MYKARDIWKMMGKYVAQISILQGCFIISNIAYLISSFPYPDPLLLTVSKNSCTIPWYTSNSYGANQSFAQLFQPHQSYSPGWLRSQASLFLSVLTPNSFEHYAHQVSRVHHYHRSTFATRISSLHGSISQRYSSVHTFLFFKQIILGE